MNRTLLSLGTDLHAMSDERPLATVASFALPLACCLIGLIGNAPLAYMLMTFLTMFFWLLCLAGLFALNGSAKASALAAVMPVNRRNQVRGKYLAAGLLVLLAIGECCVEYLLAGLFFGLDIAVGFAMLPMSAAMFLALVVVQLPFCFASAGFEKSIQLSAAAACVLVWAAILLERFLPGPIQAVAQLPAWGLALLCITAFAIAIPVSYALAVRCYARREL